MIKIKFNNTSEKIDAIFNKAGNIVTLTGDIPGNTSGFYTYSQRGALLGNYSDYTTIYRVLPDGVQFSNDGSIWVEPTTDVIITAVWDDSDNAEGLRPYEVNIKVNGNKVVLKAADNWQKIYKNEPISHKIEITEAAEIEKYEATINGTSVTYYHEWVNPEPSLEERVYDLEIAVCEIADSMA